MGPRSWQHRTAAIFTVRLYSDVLHNLKNTPVYYYFVKLFSSISCFSDKHGYFVIARLPAVVLTASLLRSDRRCQRSAVLSAAIKDSLCARVSGGRDANYVVNSFLFAQDLTRAIFWS